MDFNALGWPDHDHSLLDDSPYNNNQPVRQKKILIFFGIISLTILIIVLIVSILFICMEKQQRKPLPIHDIITSTKSTIYNVFITTVTTVFSITTNELELSSKRNIIVLYLLCVSLNSIVYMTLMGKLLTRNIY